MTVTPRSKLTSTSARTREQLILAGEGLFATRGIDNVSLRQINSEAGQRNSSAAHYHFGSKEALIEAIYEYRMERTDVIRRTWLARLVATQKTIDIRGLVEALIYPLVEHVDKLPGGRNYIRFLAQIYGHPSMDLKRMMRGHFTHTIGEIYLSMRQALPDVPDEVFGPRFGLMWALVITALADRTRLAEAAAESSLMQYTLPVLFVSNLADTAEAIMKAPVSSSTLREVDALRSGDQRLA